ncbi:unnamed protein product, partial [Acidocella sp. C78]
VQKVPLLAFCNQWLSLRKPVKCADGFGAHIECEHHPNQLECCFFFIESRRLGHGDALQP